MKYVAAWKSHDKTGQEHVFRKTAVSTAFNQGSVENSLFNGIRQFLSRWKAEKSNFNIKIRNKNHKAYFWVKTHVKKRAVTCLQKLSVITIIVRKFTQTSLQTGTQQIRSH